MSVVRSAATYLPCHESDKSCDDAVIHSYIVGHDEMHVAGCWVRMNVYCGVHVLKKPDVGVKAKTYKPTFKYTESELVFGLHRCLMM